MLYDALKIHERKTLTETVWIHKYEKGPFSCHRGCTKKANIISGNKQMLFRCWKGNNSQGWSKK